MKFGEQLSSHLTPEWRKQYIRYEALKSMLYEIMAGLPTEPEAREQYTSQMDEKFFAECDRELTKINLFYSQKIAEAQGKFHELNAELMAFKETLENRETQSIAKYSLSGITDSTALRQRIKRHSISTRNITREHAKTAQQLKLAFSEFYLALVLLQNYQQLNATGFRKILKKHDKLVENERGLDWRISRVEKSSFFVNREVETLINNVERDVINDLEGGNRQAGMKRLKVPPLSEKQHSTTTFTLGLFLGAFIVLGIAIVISWFASESRPTEPKWVAVRLFRGPLLLFVAIWLCGLNMWGWAEAGVNHVLIFEVDPRNHLTYQSVMQIASFMCMLWSLGVLGYLYCHLIHLPPFLFPLLLMIICVVYIFNPLKKPNSIFQRNSRFWILKHCFNCFTAPLHYVTFIDFWLGDQMNSLVTSFLDFQYFICFYTTEVDYIDWTLSARTVNMTTNEAIPWGYVDINTGRDMCTSSSGIRVLVSIFPATVRFMQCLRRFRDTGHARPHLINAGKYSTTYLVVFFKSLNHWAEKTDPTATSIFFYLWIASYIFSFAYTFIWDIFMDWGLIDPLAPKDSPFLREEMIYGSKWYYYGAIAEDFVLRLSWVLNISLGEAWTMESDLLTCITAPLEVFRRFVWNYFRLENEHINNCGQFRAVRDISVKPIKKGDLESLLSKMDEENGVSHRGQDLRIRVKKQKKSSKNRRQILRRARFARIAIGYHYSASSPILAETKH
ncbi:EXS family protein [Acanthocheilonema viteae]